LLFFVLYTPTPALYTLSLHDALPISGDALDQVHRGIVQDALGVGAVDEQRRREDGRGGNLVGPRRLAPALAEQHRREVEMPSEQDRKSTRLNSSHVAISYAVFCLKKK